MDNSTFEIPHLHLIGLLPVTHLPKQVFKLGGHDEMLGYTGLVFWGHGFGDAIHQGNDPLDGLTELVAGSGACTLDVYPSL